MEVGLEGCLDMLMLCATHSFIHSLTHSLYHLAIKYTQVDLGLIHKEIIGIL